MAYDHIVTFLLLAGLTGLLLLLGYGIGGNNGVKTALFLSTLMNFSAYFYSDKFILGQFRAQPLNSHTYSWVYNIVEELSEKKNMPQPKLWLINEESANAFATGRNASHASIGLSPSIISNLSRNELRAVLAHELTHIEHGDILIGTITATLASTIGYVGRMAQFEMLWGRNEQESEHQKNNPFAKAVTALIMPVAAMLLQLAVSRTREYLADEGGALTIHDPETLIAALTKIDSLNKKRKSFFKFDIVNQATASLFIVNPITAKDTFRLFSTHPPLEKRIERLEKLSQQIKQGSR